MSGNPARRPGPGGADAAPGAGKTLGTHPAPSRWETRGTDVAPGAGKTPGTDAAPGGGQTPGTDARPGRGTRERVLAAAARLLAAEGYGTFSVRRAAAEADCSTIAVYHYFGNKQGLLDAIYTEGFSRLAAAQEPPAPAAEPLQRVRAISMGLRTMALANPDYYRVMFALSVPAFVPARAVREPARRNYRRFLDAMEEWSAAQPLVTDVQTAAHVLWTSGHGMIMTELAGNTPHVDPARAYQTALEVLISGLRAG